MLFSRVVLPDPRKPVMTCTKHAAVREQWLQRAAPAWLPAADDLYGGLRCEMGMKLGTPFFSNLSLSCTLVVAVAAVGGSTMYSEPTALHACVLRIHIA